jgi:hypothetical protein
MTPEQMIEVLEAIFKSTQVEITHNHSSNGQDTNSLVMLNKNFVFDSATGKYLGCIDRPMSRNIAPEDGALYGVEIPDLFGKIFGKATRLALPSPELLLQNKFRR